ncbi:hypothetical protein N1E68_02670, partial [Pseudomonas aeruginosa]|nr:hypothetical protein [Pseudomonas aeruginosa]MCS9416949.1 hypothetical protein [Pseudomonas aeruginosa]
MNPSRRVALVAAIYLGTFIASLDISIVYLALPTLQYALDTDLAGLQWVVDVRIPRHSDTQPTLIRTPVPRSFGQAV